MMLPIILICIVCFEAVSLISATGAIGCYPIFTNLTAWRCTANLRRTTYHHLLALTVLKVRPLKFLLPVESLRFPQSTTKPDHSPAHDYRVRAVPFAVTQFSRRDRYPSGQSTQRFIELPDFGIFLPKFKSSSGFLEPATTSSLQFSG